RLPHGRRDDASRDGADRRGDGGRQTDRRALRQRSEGTRFDGHQFLCGEQEGGIRRGVSVERRSVRAPRRHGGEGYEQRLAVREETLVVYGCATGGPSARRSV